MSKLAVDKVMDALPKIQGLKPILLHPIFGAMIGVRYPYRSTSDLYVACEGYPIHCSQPGCEDDVPADGWLDHIRKHDRKTKRKRVVVTVSKEARLVEITALSSEATPGHKWERLCSVWGTCKDVEETHSV